MKVIDVYTGKEFNAKRTYGTNHVDSETLTKEDTMIMKELYGGMKIPASMAGMPHGSDFIDDNSIDAHLKFMVAIE